jgi:hypothetical protein
LALGFEVFGRFFPDLVEKFSRIVNLEGFIPCT